MVSKHRTVRLSIATPSDGTESGAVPVAEQEATETVSPLRTIVSHQRRQQRLLFAEVTGRLRRTSSDLQRLSQLRQTIEVRHPAPWSPELAGLERLLTSEEEWRQYERRYLFTAPAVQLPPPRQVDVALLEASFAGEQPMLPMPGRTCAEGFFPPQGRSRLAHNEPRPRALLPGAHLPNTVVIRLLWSTRTLLDVEYYRVMENRRMRRRQHWEFFEWSDSEDDEQQPPETLDRLESVATRRRNRNKIVMTKHEHLENWLHIAETGTDVNAAPDSEDETIALARQRRLSRRGQLLDDVDGMPAAEGDAYAPPLGRFTWGERSERKKQKGKKVREFRARRTKSRSGGDGVESLSGQDTDSRDSSDYLDDDKQDKLERAVQASKHGVGKEQMREQAGKHRPETTTEERWVNRQATGGRFDTTFPLPLTLTAGGRAGVSVSGSASRATVEERSSSAPPRPSTPRTVSDGRTANWLRVRRPTRRAGSLSPRRSPRERGSTPRGGEKHRLSAAKVRPDIEADVDLASSARATPRKHALKVPHVFEVKDYLCEDSNAADRDGADRGMTCRGAKRSLCTQRKQRMKLLAEAQRLANISEPQEVWSSSRMPGVFYDHDAINEYEQGKANLIRTWETSKENIRRYSAFQQRCSPLGSRTYDSDEINPITADYIRHLMQQRWARDLPHGVTSDLSNLSPWEVAERMVNQLTSQPFEIQQHILHEVQTICRSFPAPDDLRPISDGILASLYPATEDMATLALAIDALMLIGDQMDVVLANVLTILALGKADVRKSIQSLLERLGLVDSHQLVLAEALSWVPRGKRRNLDYCRQEVGRRALSFVGTWSRALEEHSKTIAEEVNKRKIDATAKSNIIKILKSFEPSAVEETSDGYNVTLREPSSISRLKNPEIIEVLNYFVELTDGWEETQWARRESVHGGQRPAGDRLEWRRNNKDLLVPPRPSPAVQGNRPLAVGVLRPTALVTHWQGAQGLVPGPWPTVTVGIHLRVADKYYRDDQDAVGW